MPHCFHVLHFHLSFLFPPFLLLEMNTSAQQSSQGHLSILGDIEKAAQIYSSNVDHYRHEQIYARVDWVLDLNNPIYDSDELHYCALADSLPNYKCKCAPSMTTQYVLPAVGPDDVTYAGVTYNINSKRLRKDCYRMFMLNGHQWRRSLKILRDDDGGVRAVDPLHMHYAFCLDWKAILSAQL